MLVENTGQGSIFIGAGANLSHPIYGAPRPTLEAAFAELGRRGVSVVRVSPWYRTAPVPASDQPWYVNAVAEVVTKLAPDRLLAVLHGVEQAFGRVRTVANATPRTVPAAMPRLPAIAVPPITVPIIRSGKFSRISTE